MSDGDGDARHAEPKCCVEPGVFGRDDRVPQRWRDLVVADDEAALGGEFADRLAVAREHARDGARTVVVERADLRNVAGEREEHAAQRAEQRRNDEQQDEAGLRHAENDLPPWLRFVLFFHFSQYSQETQ